MNNTLSATGRIIMVSGANRGIGYAIAEHLFDEGYSLSLGMRNPEARPLEFGEKSHNRIFVHRYDALDKEAASTWVDATIANFGRIDGLVNNAGIRHDFSIEEGDESLLDEMWAVNSKAPLRLIRAAFPYLKDTGQGRVVNIVSLSGKRVAGPSEAGYCMSKYAAAALTHAVRYSGWDDGIRATAICPGYVATDMTATVDLPRDSMISPSAIAQLVAVALKLPNSASVTEIPINCRLEHSV